MRSRSSAAILGAGEVRERGLAEVHARVLVELAEDGEQVFKRDPDETLLHAHARM
jgi:hypothetical protein